MQGALPVGELLSRSFAGTPLGRRLAEVRVWQVWEKGVGERIARVAHPLSMRDGILTVGVTNAPWLQQLRFLKGEIIARLNGVLGDETIRDIFFKSGGVPRGGEATSSPPPPRKLSEGELREIDERVSAIRDPELARILSSLLVSARRRADG